MKIFNPSKNLIGSLLSFFLLSFFSFQPNAYPAPSSYFDTIQKCYIGYYQRPADPEGLIYWADRLDRSGNFVEIINEFANSAESQELYGTINNGNISTVVNDIYNALFARDAETEGLDYYVNGFNSGQFTAATIMLNVLYGAQSSDLQAVNNKLTAANLFTRAIDPELDGLNIQVTYTGNGDQIAARNFLNLVTSGSSTVPTQDQTRAYLRTNIADPGDAINGDTSASTPVITGFTPTFGPVGTTVTITGTALTQNNSVRFNGIQGWSSGNGSRIIAIVPSGATSGPISVTTPNGTGTSVNSFYVIAGEGFGPTSGQAGISVMVSGSNFTGATEVKFNNVSATTFMVINDSILTATVPAGASSGPISVTIPNGIWTSPGSFIVLTPYTKTADNITISLTGFTADEEAWIRKYHGQLTAVLNDLTGITPVLSFPIIYDPTKHIGWDRQMQNLYPTSKPLVNQWWASWYVHELAHKYMPTYEGLTGSEINFFRMHEYVCWAITSAVLYSMKSYDFMNYFTPGEVAMWSELVTLLDDPSYAAAYLSIKPEVIHSLINNYGMNNVACDDGAMTYVTMFRYDPAFYPKFLSAWAAGGWFGPSGLRQIVASSCSASTIYGVPTSQWLAGRPLFSAVPANVPLAIDVVTINYNSNKAVPRHAMSNANVTHYYVIGKSDLTTANPPGTELWNIQPDPNLFGQNVSISIREAKTGAIMATQSTIILTGLDNQRVDLPQLPVGNYCIDASAYIAAYARTVTDTVCFSK